MRHDVKSARAIDPLFYNKIWKLDQEYNLAQYRIAEEYLNIISGSTVQSKIDTDEHVVTFCFACGTLLESGVICT